MSIDGHALEASTQSSAVRDALGHTFPLLFWLPYGYRGVAVGRSSCQGTVLTDNLNAILRTSAAMGQRPKSELRAVEH